MSNIKDFKITDTAGKKVADLPGSTLSGTIEQNKEAFDKLGELIIDHVNDSMDYLYEKGVDNVAEGVQQVDAKADAIDNKAIKNADDIAAVNTRVDYLQSCVGTPLVAATVAGMTDHDKIYVYTGSEAGYTAGDWYYWDGAAWTDGGVYNSVAFNTDTTLTLSGRAADAKVTGDEITDLKEDINHISAYGDNLFDADDATANKRLDNAGGLIDASTGNTCFTSDYIEVVAGNKYYKNSQYESSYWRICYYDSTKTFITGGCYEGNLTTAPDGACYARFCGWTSFESQAGLWLVSAKDYENRAQTSEIVNLMSDVVERTDNLYDESAKMDGYQLYSGGGIGENANYEFTNYIDITGCEKITIMFYKPQQSAHDGTQSAFYSSAKTPVTTRNQLGEVKTNEAKTFTVPSGAKYFGMAYAKSIFAEGSKIMVQSGNSYTGYEPYLIIHSSNETKEARGEFDTLGERLDSLTSRDEQSTIVYWGDSLTEGNQAGDYGTIPNYMKGMLGSAWTVYNFGRGGDMANSVACRQGGMNYVVKAGQTIPASGDVTLELTDNIGSANVGVRLYDGAWAYDSLNPCYIAGVKGKLLRVSNQYPLNQGIFTREESGSAVSIDRPTAVVSNGRNYRGYIHVISIGTNQGYDPSKPQELVDIVRWMVEYAGAEKFLIMGLYHGSNNAWQANANKALQAEFGRHFIDAEAYMKTKVYSGDTLVSSYALEDEEITPTATDLTNIANNAYPPSIMYDSTHFNKYGYECIAKLQYKRGQELGYWT